MKSSNWLRLWDDRIHTSTIRPTNTWLRSGTNESLVHRKDKPEENGSHITRGLSLLAGVKVHWGLPCQGQLPRGVSHGFGMVSKKRFFSGKYVCLNENLINTKVHAHMFQNWYGLSGRIHLVKNANGWPC